MATSSPSTADSTLIAGVIMPSPNSRPAPSISPHSSRCAPRCLYLIGVKQAVEREDAAFAFVLGADHQQRVFDGDDQRDRPDRQRDRAEHVVRRSARPGRDRRRSGRRRRAARCRCRHRRRRARRSTARRARRAADAQRVLRRASPRSRRGVAGRRLNSRSWSRPSGRRRFFPASWRDLARARLISRRPPKPVPADAPGRSGALGLHRPAVLTRR